MARLCALLASALLAACSAQQGEQASDGRVRDDAEILDTAVETRLAERLAEAQALYGPEVGVVTVNSLNGQPIEEVSLSYANAWGLGDDERQDGLMILVAPNERQVRIEVGRGVERNYPDAWAQEIIDKTMLPQFRQNKFARGLEGAVDMIVARMKQYPTAPANDNQAAATEKAA